MSYLPGDSTLDEVDRSLVTREFKLQLLKFHLARSQQRMVSRANKHRTDRQFQVGDRVYLKMQPCRQVIMSNHHFNKLFYKYYGPYMILEGVGPVAYKLAFPPELLIHATFHVSLLKFYHALPTRITHPHILNISSPFCPQPLKILDRRMI